MLCNSVLDRVGNTPFLHCSINSNLNVFLKMEYLNPTGSVKDRAASYVINYLISSGTINNETTLIESSSGNFGVALAAYCKKLNLKFICVVDPNILPVNEALIRGYGAEIIKVNQPDKNGGYLLNRIEMVKSLTKKIDNSYWVNQYGNPLVADAYSILGNEICDQLPSVDYAFLGVSSGGTITGVSKSIKERYPNSKIIAVDIEGSVVFGGEPIKRYIPGIGSSMVPDNLERAVIDDVVVIDEYSSAKACRELMNERSLCAGGSSGAVWAAIKRYFHVNTLSQPVNVVSILPDRGDRYINTVFNESWCEKYLVN